MIKICFVTTLSITIKSFLVDFAKYLVESGNFDVTFICNDDETMKQYCNERTHYIPVTMKRGISFDGLRVIKKLTNIFKKEKFDIIQYSTPNASLYASIAAKKAKCPTRLYCQWGIRYMGFKKGLKRTLFKHLEKKTCKNSTYIEVESFSIRNFGLKEKLYNEDRSCVIWNGSACGVNLTKYDISKKAAWRDEIRNALSLPKEVVVFGYAGRITKDKGANELLEAFKNTNDKRAHLLIVGDYDNENTIRNDLKEWANTSPSVSFVKWTDSIEKYYSAMDVFVSLSYREGFGLVVIEAAAMGIPCIVTNVPGQMDTIDDRVEGYLVRSKNVEDVCSALQFYINNTVERDGFGKNARTNAVKKYEQQELFKKLAEHRLLLVKGC